MSDRCSASVRFVRSAVHLLWLGVVLRRGQWAPVNLRWLRRCAIIIGMVACNLRAWRRRSIAFLASVSLGCALIVLLASSPLRTERKASHVRDVHGQPERRSVQSSSSGHRRRRAQVAAAAGVELFGGKVKRRLSSRGKMRTVKILFWRYQTHAVYIPDPMKAPMTKGCPLSRVRFVEIKVANFAVEEDRLKALRQADVVVFMFDFHSTGSVGKIDVPPKPRRETVYVLGSMERPVAQFKQVRSAAFLSRFNFLWSYHTDLPLHTTYLTRGHFTMGDFLGPAAVTFTAKLKSPLLVTLVSNCDDTIGRSALIKRLMKHIPVHNFGRCYRNVQSSNKRHMADFISKYKFVYSVENSLCSDYVTEKWARGLLRRFNSIPVIADVNGFPNYTKFTPHRRLPVYINTADFATAEDLARRLKQIGGNKKLFSEFTSYRKLSLQELNPIFVRLMEERRLKNRALCRLARYLTEDGTLSFERASQQKPILNEQCLETKIIKEL